MEEKSKCCGAERKSHHLKSECGNCCKPFIPAPQEKEKCMHEFAVLDSKLAVGYCKKCKILLDPYQ